MTLSQQYAEVVCKTAQALVHSRNRSRPAEEQDAILRCLRIAVRRLEDAQGLEAKGLHNDLETIGAFTWDEFCAFQSGRDLEDGPYVRELPDGRVQFYAYVKKAA